MKKYHKHRPKGLEIVYEDRDLIVVNKDAGLLTRSSDPYEEQTAECLLNDYVRKGAARSRLRVYVVHALDRASSGLVVFAKTTAVKRYFIEHADELKCEYLVLVHGTPKETNKTISSYLVENQAHFMYSTSRAGEGPLAETTYCVVRENEAYSALTVWLKSNRKDQIRVHLAELGHPVVGDSKYGPKEKSVKRLALLCRSVSFKHPHSEKPLSFEVSRPLLFDRLMKQR